MFAARVVPGIKGIKHHWDLKVNQLVARSRAQGKAFSIVLFESLYSRLTFVLKWIWFLINPKFDYMGWKKRTTQDSFDRYALNRSSQSNLFLWNRMDIEKSKSVLEIGSNSGNRIIELAKRHPSTVFHGYDVNLPAIELGNQVAKNEKITNLKFFVRDVSNLECKNATDYLKYDVVVSWATLIYVHPRNIRKSIRFIVESTNKRIILIEQQSLKSARLNVFKGGVPLFLEPTWKRNYLELISSISDRRFCYNICEVPKEIWNPGGGCAHALIIDFEEALC